VIDTIAELGAHKKLSFQFNQLKVQTLAMMVKGSTE